MTELREAILRFLNAQQMQTSSFRCDRPEDQAIVDELWKAEDALDDAIIAAGMIGKAFLIGNRVVIGGDIMGVFDIVDLSKP